MLCLGSRWPCGFCHEGRQTYRSLTRGDLWKTLIEDDALKQRSSMTVLGRGHAVTRSRFPLSLWALPGQPGAGLGPPWERLTRNPASQAVFRF